MKDFRIIGLAGRAGSGKDTVADIIRHQHGAAVNILSFAAPLKTACAALFEEDIGLWNDPSHKEQCPGGFPFTRREFMQRFGTEFGRDIIGNRFNVNLWMKLLEEKLSPILLNIITDVRFDSEALLLRSEGAVIWRVERGSADIPVSHSSEVPISDRYVDKVIDNNGTLDELHEIVKEALSK